MRNSFLMMLTGLCGLVALACGGEGSGGNGGPFGGGGSGGSGLDCSTLTDPPQGCEDACPSGSDSECERGTFCENGRCTAQCTAQEGCAEGSTCNVRGRCVPDLGTGGTGGTGNTGGSNGCQSVQVTPTRSIPNVMFLVDRSGSMNANFGGSPRWDVAHDAIMSVVNPTQSIVRYGLATYHWNDDVYSLTNPAHPECPIVGPLGPDPVDFQPVDFALNNASTIASNYPANWSDLTDPQKGNNDTPTGESIDKVVSWIAVNQPPAEGPTIIVLATDGEPDTCEFPDSNQSLARSRSVQAATDAFSAGIETFVLSVGSQVGEDHLQDMANVGVGLPVDGSGGDAQFWVGNDPAGLESAFREIIGGSISCEVQIDKPFDDREKACDEGDVRLNGTPLSCPTDWQVKDEPPYDVIELVGSACETFKSGESTFTAEFPCGAILVQ